MELADTGLRKQPFRTDGTPLIMVPYAAQTAAIRFLGDTRSNDRGLGLFHGPPLSGKTSIIRQFIASLPDDYAIAVVDGANMNGNALLQNVLSQFGYDHGFNSAVERFNMLRVFAMQQTTSDGAPLIIIENAHALSPISFDLLCELAELEVNGKSALRIVFASDRPMLPIVRAPAMQTISERVTGQFFLQPLTQKETTDYVYKKMISGGCSDPKAVLPLNVCNSLHAVSGGWPGLIDRLTMAALSNADRCPVSVEHIPRMPRPAAASTGVSTPGQQASKPSPAKTSDSIPHLILTCHGKTLKRMAADRPRFIIGRNEHSDLRILHDFISRHHAILLRIGNATIIVDLKSKNGTCVNGKRISCQVLINNDIITLGEHRIKFIDPAATRRTTLRGAGWDETVKKSVVALRKVIGKN